MKKILKSNLLLLFIVLILLRIGALYLAAHDIPYTRASETGFAWWAKHGGDEVGYFKSAQILYHWEFLPRSHPLGFPLLIAPLVKIFDARQPADIAFWVVVMHSVLFYSLAALLVYVLAKKILRSVRQASLILILFLIYPYIFYYFFDLLATHNQIIENFKISRFKQLMFIHYGSDPLSTVLMLSSLLLLLKIVKSQKENVSLALVLGLTAGWAAITRMQNVIVGPFYAVCLLWWRRFKSFFYFALGAAPLILFQIYVNWHSNGSPFKTAYGLKKGPNLDIDFFSLKYPLRVIEYPLHYSPWLFLPMIGGAVLIFLGIYKVIKLDKNQGIILAGFLLANSVFILFCEPTMRNPRYFLPVIPLFFIFSLEGISFLYQKIWQRKNIV